MSFLVTSSTAASTIAAQAEHLARRKNAAEERERRAREDPVRGILRRVLSTFNLKSSTRRA